MPNRNLEVALRIKAQTEGKQAVDDLGRSLSTLGDGADQNLRELEAELAALSGDVRKTGTEAQSTAGKMRGVGDAAEGAAGRAVAANHKVRDSVESISMKLSDLQKAVLTYLGVTNFGPMLQGLAATADEYQNVSARIRLVAGDGEALQAALSGVERVAMQTHSPLSTTADLFAKIYTAGKEMKMSQEQALALTQTINQAIQVSGASAQAADAATIQLIQGLQSGVLRGEEFNSVMEQSPRLAKALADGLGVPIGKLREMANAGVLSSEVVINALQSQGRVIEQEFGKMPQTVGRAMADLKNSWTVFIGETDKAEGVSQKAAWAINLLARNLDTVAAAAMAGGKAWLAYRAWNIADEFLLISKATQAAAAAKVQDTAATVANTTATAANTAAQVANKSARLASAAAAGNVAGAVGKLGAALNLVKGFSWAFLLTNLPEIGKWLGEFAARLAGHGKALEENERRQKAYAEAARASAQQDAELAAKKKAAEEAALGLNEASKKLVAGFDESKKAGKSTTEAVTELAKALQLGDLKGIGEAGAALDALAQRGKLSAAEVERAWAQALSGQDLQVFVTTAQAAFDGSEQGARRLAAAMDGAVAEALRRTGKDMSELTTGVSAAARSAINDVDLLVGNLDALGEKGVNVGDALAGSLDKATDAAKTEAAIREVINRLEQLGQRGLITGDQLKEGLEKAQKKLDDLKPGIQSVDEAFRQLGMKTPAQLNEMAERSREAFEKIRQSGVATPAQLSEAFKRYADAAIAANGGVATEALKIQAEMRGVVLETNEAGKATARLASETHKLRDAQQRSDRPGSGGQRNGGGIGMPSGLTDPGDLPNGLTLEQLQSMSLTSQEIENYQLNRGPNQKPGQVNRWSYGFNTDTESVARANGFRGDDVKRFAELFPRIVEDKIADMRTSLSALSIGTPKGYTDAFGSAWQAAVAEVRTKLNEKPEPGGRPDRQLAKVYRVDLTINGQRTPVNVADEKSAQALIDALQRGFEVASTP